MAGTALKLPLYFRYEGRPVEVVETDDGIDVLLAGERRIDLLPKLLSPEHEAAGLDVVRISKPEHDALLLDKSDIEE